MCFWDYFRASERAAAPLPGVAVPVTEGKENALGEQTKHLWVPSQNRGGGDDPERQDKPTVTHHRGVSK